MFNKNLNLSAEGQPDYFRNTPFEFETTSTAYCNTFIVSTFVPEPAGTSLFTANPLGGHKDNPSWVPRPPAEKMVRHLDPSRK